jgi:hypothetical protein
MAFMRSLVFLVIGLIAVAINGSAFAQGYVITTPGQTITTVHPTPNGYTVVTPGQSITNVYRTPNGYTVVTPGQSITNIKPSPSPFQQRKLFGNDDDD